MKKTPNTFIKPSKIHGLGLFAKRDISKGEQIIHGTDDFSFLDEWIEYVKKWKTASFAHNNGYCMMNHSDTPNTHRQGNDMEVIASCDIKHGQEITEDYNALPDEENPFKQVFNLEEMVWRAKRWVSNKAHPGTGRRANN